MANVFANPNQEVWFEVGYRFPDATTLVRVVAGVRYDDLLAKMLETAHVMPKGAVVVVWQELELRAALKEQSAALTDVKTFLRATS